MRYAKIYISVVSIFLFGCGTAVPTGGTGLSAQSEQAICQISTAGSVVVVCIGFSVNTAANQTSCSTNEVADYAAEGGTNNAYFAAGSTPGSATVSVSCALQEAALTLVGSCALPDRSINYYSTIWSVATAKMDCSARAGNWVL